MAIPVQIGDRHFPTKAAATAECQRILNKYPGTGLTTPGPNPGLGQAVDDPEDIAFLHELVALHPYADDKIGAGVTGFEVRVNETGQGGTRCFRVLRKDGSSEDFGYPKCIDNAAAQQQGQ